MGTIEIVGLTRAFKGKLAVNAVDLVIEDGDFCVLLGPSGCGKTTLLRMIAGLLEPTAGSIELDGLDITDVPSKKRDIAMVFQSYALYPHLSVYRQSASARLVVHRNGLANVAQPGPGSPSFGRVEIWRYENQTDLSRPEQPLVDKRRDVLGTMQ